MVLWTQIKANLSFLLMCGGIVLALYLVAKISQRFLPNVRPTTPARRVSIIGICAAIAAVLHMLDFPLLFLAPEFYKLDLSELPVLICTFYLGPVAGVVSELLKVALKLILKGTTTAFVGDFANFAVGCSFVLPASVFYHSRPSRQRAVLGLVVGTLVMTVFGSAFNAVYLLPKFSALFGMPLDVIVGMGTKVNSAIQSVSTLVLFAVVPFNLLKGVVVSLLTMLLYKRVSPLLHLGDDKKKERKEAKKGK